MEILIKKINSDIRRAKAELAKWAEDFAADPHHAVNWSDSMFAATANLRVATEVLNMLEKSNSDTDHVNAVCLVVGVLTDKVISHARHPQNSTSNSSNHLYLEMTRAYAEMMQEMNWVG